MWILCRRNWPSCDWVICNFGKYIYSLRFPEVKWSLLSFSFQQTSFNLLLIIRLYCNYDSIISRKEARNSFNLLIVALTCVDLVFCVALMSDYCFVRTFGLSTNIYTMMFPYFVYPLVNITLTASIYMTVILALER